MVEILSAIWGTAVYILFGDGDGGVVMRADPVSIVMAATAAYSAVEGQDQARRANKERENAKKQVKAREAELAAEAAAKEATRKKAETAGQRAGFGAGAAGAGAAPTRASFTASAQAGGSSVTGMGNSGEDNISRGTLFGN